MRMPPPAGGSRQVDEVREPGSLPGEMSIGDRDLDVRMRRAAEQAIDHFLSAPQYGTA